MNKYLTVIAISLMVSCSSFYDDNEEAIEKLVINKEAGKNDLKKIVITGHKESSHQITVFVRLEDVAKKLKLDTLKFSITGDGIVIQQ